MSDQLERNLPVLTGVKIPLKDRVHSLGVLLDLALPMEAQISAMARNAFYQLWLIARLHPFLDKNV